MRTRHGLALGALALTLLAGCSDSPESAVINPSGTPHASESPDVLPGFSVRPVLAIRKGTFHEAECVHRDAPTAGERATACFDERVYVLGPEAIGPANVESVISSNRGSLIVHLNEQGTALLATLTESAAEQRPPRNQLAVVRGGEVVAAPSVQAQIRGGAIEVPRKL